MTKKEEHTTILRHEFVPRHELMKEQEVEKLLKEYGITKAHLPKVYKSDPAIAKMELKRGDVVKIERKSPTAIKSYYYRVVV